jgi:hypothetical protein
MCRRNIARYLEPSRQITISSPGTITPSGASPSGKITVVCPLTLTRTLLFSTKKDAENAFRRE